MRKVNADDKRQGAELTELDGGDLRREPLDTRKATLALLLKHRTCASTSGPAARGCGRLRIASTDVRRNEKSSALGALPPCGCDMVAS